MSTLPPRLSSRTRHLGALAIMCLGMGATFGLLLAMNAKSAPPRAPAGEAAAAFTLAAPPPPPKQERVRPERKRMRSASAPAAPAPNLGTNLSGVGFGLAHLDTSGVLDAASDLVNVGEAGREMTMTEDAVDKAPQATERRAPAYPPRARARGVTGQVVLNLLIGPDGEVERVKVIEASPAGVFEEAATDAVRAWRFDPATYRGRRVKVWARQVLRFELG